MSTSLRTVSVGLDSGVRGLLRAGERALHVEGDLRAGRHWFDTAYTEAERSGDDEAMAVAALGLGGLWLHEHRSLATAALVQERQQRALDLVEPDSSLALRLRVRLAAEADYRTGQHATVLAAVDEARLADDRVALVEALSLAHHCVLGPDHGALRRRLAEELITEGSRTGRRGDVLMGLLWQTINLMLDDDPHALRRLAELNVMLDQDDHLAVGYVTRSMSVLLAIRAGQWGEAERSAVACAEYGATAGDLDATGWYGAQLVAIRWFQGRVGELAPTLSALVNSPTLSAVDNSYFGALAVAAATAGDSRQAAGTLARLRVRDLADLPRSSSWLVAMNGIVEAAYLLADADTSIQAYDLLAGYARLPMVASLGAACFGSVHHALGVASLTVDDHDRAIGHFRSAVRHNLALGHWPAVTLSRWRLGATLAQCGRHRDAAVEREAAEQEAARLGMALPAWRHEAEPTGRATPAPRPHRVVCQRRGRQWKFEMGHRKAVVSHSVGLKYLAVLLASPGQEVHAADLAADTFASEVAADSRGGSTQPIIDEVAGREYRRRLSELESEIEEADAAHDLDRATGLRTERDWLVAELTAATGLGGRSRQFTGDAERARVAVGKAIRRAIDRIEQADPVIATELRTTVQTGQRCSYRPD